MGFPACITYTGKPGSSAKEAKNGKIELPLCCLLYTSDAADERSSVDLGGRRIIKKQQKQQQQSTPHKNCK